MCVCVWMRVWVTNSFFFLLLWNFQVFCPVRRGGLALQGWQPSLVKKTYDLFTWATIHRKKCLCEVKLCFFVSIEAQVRHLNQKIFNPSKMLTSAKLMYVPQWKKISHLIPFRIYVIFVKVLNLSMLIYILGTRISKMGFLFWNFGFFHTFCKNLSSDFFLIFDKKILWINKQALTISVLNWNY